MSSWLSASAPPRPMKAPRTGFNQILPEGTFVQKDKPATVVSAYYQMPSKYPNSEYKEWIRLFLENVPCHLVFYTEEALFPFISECRRNFEHRTTIIKLPREEWVANKKYSQTVWNNLHKQDPEATIHTPELYKIWFEKNEFVRRAIELNPYGHDDFVWTDAGICRTVPLLNLVRNFPIASRIPTDRIMLLNTMPFVARDDIPVKVNGQQFVGGVVSKPRIGGGVIAGSADSWQAYAQSFDTVLEKYKKAGLFWGKDQDVMKTVVLENKSKVSLIEVKPIAPELWFYSLLYLGCSNNLWNVLRDEKRNDKKKSYAELLALS